jgi:peptide/nickel transport system substrate-binding protein
LLAIVALLALGALVAATPAAAADPAPAGQMTWAVHFTLAPRWLDPAESEGTITPFLTLYAVHDALLKPMPAGAATPCLAESWSLSPDGLVYSFVLRNGVRFHNGEMLTAEDVKFSFERYRGAAAPLFKARVREVQVVDASRVRFHLTEEWPDFMTFYGTSASGAAWIVPKKYIEKVGEDAFRRAPIGAGPYKFVSFQPSHARRRARARPRAREGRRGACRCRRGG